MELDEEKLRHELFGGPRKRVGRFYLQAVRDDEASAKAGYPVFADVEYCHVVLKGGNEARPEDFSYRSTETLQQEFPQAYALFLKIMARRQTDFVLLRGYTPSIGATLHEIGIHCVEDLATATGGEFMHDGKARKCAFPAALYEFQHEAKRYIAYVDGLKPRFRVVGGEFKEMANG